MLVGDDSSVVPAVAATTPAQTWGTHDTRCAWTAAWLTLRGRTYLGPREILDHPEWSGQLAWLDRHGFKRCWHRPDLVGFLSDRAITIEVELAPKPKPRLDAILLRHLGWIVARKTYAVIYICGDQDGWRRIEKTGERIRLYRADRRFRIELLDTIK